MSNDSNISTIGVVGIDGKVPVYDPTARWCMWSINEIYTGAEGARYIPKIKDYVIDPDLFIVYIVDSIDNVTLIPTLREIRPHNMSYSFSQTDVLFGVGPGTQADTYRVYFDRSVTPHILAVDARLKIAGTMTNYAKLFKGSNVGSNGHVVSKMIDSSGNYISENIPLELSAIDSHANYSIKVIPPCYSNEELVDGEIITAVLYSADGNVVSKRQLLVENTTFIRGVSASQKYISHISLECPFLSPTVDHVIEFPLNIPTNALNLMGVVHYSDGSVVRLPVNGGKFKIFGLEQYVSSIIGQRIELVLSYALSVGETAYAGISGDGKYLTEPYSLITSDQNNSYTVKVFGYPVWVDDSVGYRMSWHMFNLDRNVYFDVTPYVRFAENTGGFDPRADGYMQRKAILLNLRDVSGSFKPFVHTQVVEVMLRTPPGGQNTPWSVSHESVSNRPAYGSGLRAVREIDNVRSIRISAGSLNLDDWLSRVYYSTYPLVDKYNGASVPVPTHFELSHGTSKTIYPIEEWDQVFTFTGTVNILSTVFIRFFKRTAVTDLQLSMAAMMVTDI